MIGIVVNESELLPIRELLGKINANVVGKHLPHTLLVTVINYDDVVADGRYQVSFDIERSESIYGHNFAKNPTTGRYHEIRSRDGSRSLFEATEFPEWVSEFVNS